ncbi:HDOD domain-containing protein [Oceanospirillum sediminis]|uniref:HDOD domain-containing protein n=1 Tax=Oceanospirillum sediminis TaxID=2760088 RepID=A0A839ING0_9GAMM|nr:HDOD domain-containing protein [Oceanospirillum sediminis]MBB1486039.1 HDOD domain-containing protein [Oceanospirillum sediminis]
MYKDKNKKVASDNKPYVIPARPEALITIVELMKTGDPDAGEIAEILKKDVYLYASVLAAVNTPHTGLCKKITDLSHAITLLGVDKLFAIVRLAALKNSLSKTGRLDRFWDSATEVAELSASLAKKLTDADSHKAYTLGMMHDCGIPLMLESQPEYKAFLRTVNGNDLTSVSIAEQERFGIDHFALGADIAEKWYMPEYICDAIRLQAHYDQVLTSDIECSDEARTLLSILILAKDISSIYRRFWRIYDTTDPLPELKEVLKYIGVPDIEYLDLREDFLGYMVQKDLNDSNSQQQG